MNKVDKEIVLDLVAAYILVLQAKVNNAKRFQKEFADDEYVNGYNEGLRDCYVLIKVMFEDITE